MCGRFYVDDETAKEIQKLVRKIDEQLKKAKLVGDVHPTELAAVIEAENRELRATAKRWGFPGFGNQKVLINARAETVMEKRMFRDNVQCRRVAIPAAGFYEWNQAKEKVTFTAEGAEPGKARILYLAGFYGNFDGEDRFIILTTEANESMKDVHHRMPLILEQDEVKEWICDDGKVNQFLRKRPGQLKRRMDYEQQRLML